MSARDVALCRSLLYDALALGFLPPTGQTCARLGTETSAWALGEAAAYLDDDQKTELARRARHLCVPTDARDPVALADSYLALFGHTARGPVSPYETEYGDDTLFQKPQEMSDIAGFLRAFGLERRSDCRERTDHIGIELEFVAFLARKEAYALETGDAAMAEETRKATRLFLKDHLARFVPAFTYQVRRADPSGFYGALADLCQAMVAAECARFQTPLGSESLRLRLPIEDNAPMACGTGDCAPGVCDAEGNPAEIIDEE